MIVEGFEGGPPQQKRCLASIVISAVVFITAIARANNLQTTPRTEDTGVSPNQGKVDWDVIVDGGISFAHTEATAGFGKRDGALILLSTNVSLWALPAPTSGRSIVA